MRRLRGSDNSAECHECRLCKLDFLPAIQQAVSMKATFNLPDDLYREVKARSALEGRPVREVVVALFKQWLGQQPDRPKKTTTDWRKFDPPLRRFVSKEVTDHSMESMRESITKKFDDTV